MIDTIVSKFQSFRNRLFQCFQCRADATMDLIDATAAGGAADSIVKSSLSSLFRRTYSSITDVLDNLFRPTVKQSSEEQSLAIAQLVAEEAPLPAGKFALFAIDCTANPRVFSEKVSDRTVVHAPNHVPGQKSITIGHEYSVVVHIPDDPSVREYHWVIPLSIRRVSSTETGPQVGFKQFKQMATQTRFRDHLCVAATDAAYSIDDWIVGVDNLPNAVQIARLRGNRKLFRKPLQDYENRRGRPVLYGEEVPLSAPPKPDQETSFEITTPRGRRFCVMIARWNDLIAKGSKKHKMHLYPFDVVRAIVIDENGRRVYKRPLWLMIAGRRRREIKSGDVFHAYSRRYDIEHFFRFGKQKLGMTNSQTCDTRHEENWLWITVLAYTMLYHAHPFAQERRHPWERRRMKVIRPKQTPTMVQRDYDRIIRGIGTPASVPKPRGKSTGRREGSKGAQRGDCPFIRKTSQEKQEEKRKRGYTRKVKRTSFRRIRKTWEKTAYDMRV